MILLAVMAGVLAAAWAHGASAGHRAQVRRRDFDQRFLCPHCLCFGDFRFACGACGKEVDAFLVHTEGAYVNHCLHCRSALFPRDGQGGCGVKAYCRRCQGACPCAVYHERSVRVLATLLPGDLIAFCGEAAGAKQGRTNGDGYAFVDDGARLTCVLDLSSVTRPLHRLASFHVARSIEALWLDGGGLTPLEIGQAVDRFIREAGLTEQQRETLAVWVRQGALEPAAQHLLAGRRFGAVRYGMTAEVLRCS